MRCAILRVVAVAVVATCFAGLISQAFDRWDRGEAKGKDTESTLILVALSVGLAIPAATLLLKTSSTTERESNPADVSLGWIHPVFAVPPAPVSQPPPVLRI